jgi:hypothetical protein
MASGEAEVGRSDCLFTPYEKFCTLLTRLVTLGEAYDQSSVPSFCHSEAYSLCQFDAARGGGMFFRTTALNLPGVDNSKYFT